jgi:hypothetical protein
MATRETGLGKLSVLVRSFAVSALLGLALCASACAAGPQAVGPQAGGPQAGGPQEAAPPPGKANGFERFCASWMTKLRDRQKANERSAHFQRRGDVYVAEFTGYGSAPLSCSARPTGKPAAPFVGKLVYHEIRYSKSGASPAAAQKVEPRELYRIEVMELFRYDGSAWLY